MYVRTDRRMYVRTCVRMYARTNVRTSVRLSVRPSVSPSVRPSVRTYVHTYVHTYIVRYVRTYVCTQVTYVRFGVVQHSAAWYGTYVRLTLQIHPNHISVCPSIWQNRFPEYRRQMHLAGVQIPSGIAHNGHLLAFAPHGAHQYEIENDIADTGFLRSPTTP